MTVIRAAPNPSALPCAQPPMPITTECSPAEIGPAVTWNARGAACTNGTQPQRVGVAIALLATYLAVRSTASRAFIRGEWPGLTGAGGPPQGGEYAVTTKARATVGLPRLWRRAGTTHSVQFGGEGRGKRSLLAGCLRLVGLWTSPCPRICHSAGCSSFPSFSLCWRPLSSGLGCKNGYEVLLRAYKLRRRYMYEYVVRARPPGFQKDGTGRKCHLALG